MISVFRSSPVATAFWEKMFPSRCKYVNIWQSSYTVYGVQRGNKTYISGGKPKLASHPTGFKFGLAPSSKMGLKLVMLRCLDPIHDSRAPPTTREIQHAGEVSSSYMKTSLR